MCFLNFRLFGGSMLFGQELSVIRIDTLSEKLSDACSCLVEMLTEQVHLD
jgi:hypothetical protein